MKINKPKIGLFDVDSVIPNLALMKLSAYYKKWDYEVEFYSPLFHKEYWLIYASKIFNYPHPNDAYLRNDMILGGPGFYFSEKFKRNFHVLKELPKEIDHFYPDYELYNCNFAMGYLCYDKDTQILTNKGWKYFRNLLFQDKILTLNPLTYSIEYQKPSEIIKREYNGKLIHFYNKYIDLLVTPNHNLYVKTRRSKKEKEVFELKRANSVEDLYSFRFKKDGLWEGKEEQYFYLPKIKNYRNTCNLIKKIPMDLWLEFLGYFVSEGNARYNKRTHSYLIQIAQSKKSPYHRKIENCIIKLDLNYYIDPHGSFVISNKQLYSYLKPLGYSYQKYIPQEFLMLCPRQLEILFEAIYVGDGTHYKGKNAKTKGIITTSYRLASNIQELLLKLGFCGDIRLIKEKGTVNYVKKLRREIISRHNCYIIYRNTHYTNPNHFGKTSGKTERVAYVGKVYCCTVPNGIVYVRRNGKAVWCGNSKGCIRDCPFCIVPEMEGMVYKFADLEEFCRDQEKVRLLDNNILGYKDHINELKKLRDSEKRIDFNQGLDIRLITPENAKLLYEIKRWKGLRLRFAFDDPSLKKIIQYKLKILNDVGISNGTIQFYVLIGFNTTHYENLRRILFLKNRRIDAFVMPYDKLDPYQRNFARWVNRYYYKYQTWEEYLSKKPILVEV